MANTLKSPLFSPETRVAVLGAGPSGLGVAWGLLEQGISSVIVIEKSERVGGLSGSFQFGGATWDIGPHRFSPEFPDLVQKIATLLGDDWLKVSNEHAVVFRDRVYRYPPVIDDFLNVPTLSFSLKVLASYVLHRFSRSKEKASFASHIERTFGPALYKEVVAPLCEKVWGNPQDLEPSFAKLRFSVPTFVQWGKKLLHHRSTFSDRVFYYPRYGFQQLWTRLSQHLQTQGMKIHTSSWATQIETEGDRITGLRWKRGNETFYEPIDWLVSTIPTPDFLKLMPESSGLTQTLGDKSLPTRPLILFSLLLKKKPDGKTILPARVVIFPEKKYLFNRLSEQNQFSADTVPEGLSAVQLDLLTDLDSEIWKLSDEALLEKILETLLPLGFFEKSQIVASHTLRLKNAYPRPTLQREQTQNQINEGLSAYSNLLCTGRLASSDYNNSHSALKKSWLAAQVIAENNPELWLQHAEEIRRLPIRD